MNSCAFWTSIQFGSVYNLDSVPFICVYNVDVDVNIEIDVNMNIDINVEINIDINVDINIEIDIDIII